VAGFECFFVKIVRIQGVSYAKCSSIF
jgi:hypothetical protein